MSLGCSGGPQLYPLSLRTHPRPPRHLRDRCVLLADPHALDRGPVLPLHRCGGHAMQQNTERHLTMVTVVIASAAPIPASSCRRIVRSA